MMIGEGATVRCRACGGVGWRGEMRETIAGRMYCLACVQCAQFNLGLRGDWEDEQKRIHADVVRDRRRLNHELEDLAHKIARGERAWPPKTRRTREKASGL